MDEDKVHTEIKIINISLGCSLRLERLKRKLSQYTVGINSGTDNTTVGRIERAEHDSSWSKIFLISQCLDVDFTTLFTLKSKTEILHIVNECHSLDGKLSKEKEQYYSELINKIETLFSEISL